MIRVEKIGSGNWYWSFPSQDQIIKKKMLEDAQSAHDKAFTVVQDLKQNLADKAAQREEEEDMLDSGGDSREDVIATKAGLEAELKKLQKELAAYRDSDPTELERKQNETKKLLADAEQYTDEIYSLEGWFSKMAGDETVKGLKLMLYGDEYDEEEGGLRELI
jgi:chromosome segregation ATPase